MGGCSTAPVTLAKRKNNWSEIPFVCLQNLFPGFYQGCSFPQEYFFVAEEARDARAPGMTEAGQCPKSGGADLAGLLALIREKIRIFLHFLLRAVSVCETAALPSHVILQQSRFFLCKKPSLLIIQEHVPLPMFHATPASGSAIVYIARQDPRTVM